MTQVSTKPYLLRAIYEWCVDQGFTPYMAVAVDKHTMVPRAYVKDDQIVLNIGPTASNQLQIGNDLITFQARFNGQIQNLSVPVANVCAIYAKENGEGMGFEVDLKAEAAHSADLAPRLHSTSKADPGSTPPTEPSPPSSRPRLTRIK